jgi:multiple sugar transport system substrate-binding protein
VKFTRHRLVTATVAAGLVASLAGCGAASGTGNTGTTGEYTAPDPDITANLTISNWGNPGDEELYQAAIDRFNEKYPNVTVTDNVTQVVNWSDYINKILTSIASGDSPDIINIATEGVEFGLSKNLFLPLTNYIEQDESVKSLIDDINPNLIAGFTKDGDTYLVPNNWNAMVVYYNKAMFDAAGIERPSDDWTWDDFHTIAGELTSGSGSSKTYGFGLQTYTFAYYPWLYSNGGSIATDDLSAPALDSPETIEAVQFLQNLVLKDGFAPDPAGTEANQLFQAGKVAMTAAPANLSAILVADAPDLEFGILPMPQNTEKKTVFGAAGFSVYQGSKNQDLAWELIKELASQKTQAGWAELGTSNPTTLTAATSDVFVNRHPDASVLYDAIEYAKPVAAPTFFTTLEPAFQRALQAIMAGGDPAEELAKAQAEVEATVGNG